MGEASADRTGAPGGAGAAGAPRAAGAAGARGPAGADGARPRARGAAPLFRGADFGIPDAVPCPFCDGADTELHAAFGSALSVVTYWCRRCRTAFEWMKQ